MMTGKDNKSTNSPVPVNLTQAYFGAKLTQPSIFTSSVAASSTLYPHNWGNQSPSIQSYATPLQYPVMYHHSGHLGHSRAGFSLTLSEVEAEGKKPNGNDRDSKRKRDGCLDNREFVGGRSKESRKTVLESGNDDASHSGSQESSDECHDKAHQNELSTIKEKSSNQMLANGLNSENNTISHCFGANSHGLDVGDLFLPLPASKLNARMNSPAPSSGSKSMMLKLNACCVPQPVVSAMMDVHEEVISEQPIQDADKLKKQKKRRDNNESVQKSRLRKKQIEQLEAQVEEVKKERSMLSSNLKMRSEKCMKLKEENKSLLKELKQMYGADVISRLEAMNPDHNPHSHSDENNGDCPESPAEYNS